MTTNHCAVHPQRRVRSNLILVLLMAAALSGCAGQGPDNGQENRGATQTCAMPGGHETTTRDPLISTVPDLAVAGCGPAASAENSQGFRDGNDPEKDKGKDKEKDKKGDGEESNATLPPPIHDERDVPLAVGGASGTAAECSDTRPCFDYPFTLQRSAIVNINATRSDPAHGIAVELLAGSEQVTFVATGVNAPPVAIEETLEPGDYLVRVHAFRMVNGHFVLDVTFHVPPPAGTPDLADPLLDRQWGLPMARVPEAWAYATGKNVTIAIIDTGIDLDHPDLKDKLVILPGADFLGGNLQDNDGHGTWIAGVAAAARNNGIGVAGVAPDAKIMPLRILASTAGNDPTIAVNDILLDELRDRMAQAIRMAADNGAQVISMSVSAHAGGGETLPLLAPQVQEALDYAWSKGVVIVAAAGGLYGWPFCSDIGSHPNALCVGSVGPTGDRAPNSNMPIATEFVMAPGGDDVRYQTDCSLGIWTTAATGDGRKCKESVDGAWYVAEAGTSLSAPFAAGVAALLVEQGLTNAEILQRIKDTADPTIGSQDELPDPNPMYGFGLVNAYCAVTNGDGEGC